MQASLRVPTAKISISKDQARMRFFYSKWQVNLIFAT